MGINLVHVQAERFWRAWLGSQIQEKRKRIGHEFIRAFEEEAFSRGCRFWSRARCTRM